MSKADTLLKRATAFERLALYGDRRSFLTAIAQQNSFDKIQVTESGPYGAVIGRWLQEAQNIGKGLQAAIDNPEPGTSIDVANGRAVAEALSNATAPINLSYLLGYLGEAGQMGGEGSGTKIPQLANAARSLAARFTQAYTARPKAAPAAQMMPEAVAALGKVGPLMRQWQNVMSTGMIDMMSAQDYEALQAASKELDSAIAQASSDNPYNTPQQDAQAKASLPALQKAKQQMSALLSEIQKWQSTHAGFMRRVPGPTA